MSPLGSSSEEADSLFKSAENTYYKNFVANLVDEEEESSSLSEPEDFVPYYQFWNLPIDSVEHKKEEK